MRQLQPWFAIGSTSRYKKCHITYLYPIFNFAFFGTGTNNLRTDPTHIGRHDPTTERPAVPNPTPVSFPTAETIGVGEPITWTQGNAPDLYARFAKIRKPPDVTVEHLQDLNLRFLPSCNFEDLLGTN